MHLSTDQLIFWQHGFLKLNGTIVYTWGLMLVLALGAKLITRRLTTGISISRWQCALEIIVLGIKKQIEEVGLRQPEKYLGFVGTLFLFVAIANIFTILPGYEPPTGSLSTTAALALCVFVAVPFYGIKERGWGGYLRSYLEPTVIMLPFNIISEFSRTLALAVRLFGNMMSGTMILGILLIVTPFLFPVVMSALGLLTGMVQAYIFSVLALVYIAAAIGTKGGETEPKPDLEFETKGRNMDNNTIIAAASIISAGLTMGIGAVGPGLGQGRAVAAALSALAQQPDASSTITRTLFVGLAMIESMAIYCFVISMILIFANPFWNHAITQATGK